MSIDYECQPISAIKYDRLKYDVSKGQIEGLKLLNLKRGSYIPKGVGGGYHIADRKGRGLTVHKLNRKGDAVFTAYNLKQNDPFPILDKLSVFYRCDYVDEHDDKFVTYRYGKGVRIK
jgi:hypothetical protein